VLDYSSSERSDSTVQMETLDILSSLQDISSLQYLDTNLRSLKEYVKTGSLPKSQKLSRQNITGN